MHVDGCWNQISIVNLRPTDDENKSSHFRFLGTDFGLGYPIKKDGIFISVVCWLIYPFSNKDKSFSLTPVGLLFGYEVDFLTKE